MQAACKQLCQDEGIAKDQHSKQILEKDVLCFHLIVPLIPPSFLPSLPDCLLFKLQNVTACARLKGVHTSTRQEGSRLMG